jgi:L-asparagine transporter-like permease
MSTNLILSGRKMALREKFTGAFSWIGITMSVLCVALAAAGNTALAGRFNPAGFPVSWAAGLMAIAAFLAWEYCYPTPAKTRAPRQVAQQLTESLPWETEFADQ